eukprot:s261_g7.t1
MSEQVVEAEASSVGQGGRQRRAWRVLESHASSEGSLRVQGQRWLQAKSILYHTLTNSSHNGRTTLIARCKRCIKCSKSWCFSFNDQDEFIVETVGDHEGPANSDVLKRHHAKIYGDKATPSKALKQMKVDKVVEGEVPSASQLKYQRRQSNKTSEAQGFSDECMGELREFVEAPPAGVRILSDHMVLEQDCIRLPFAYDSEDVDAIWKNSGMSSFLCDFTFCTNCHGLLLGACGPVGVIETKRGPHMRFLPVVMMLASSEDEESPQLLFSLFLDKSHELGVDLEHGFLDCSCYQAISAANETSALGLKLSRCLQHVAWQIFVSSCSGVGLGVIAGFEKTTDRQWFR